ncbi:MAG: hypothetical protein IT437_04470 [Phycisphaerales bacterium]|nr:hypothetical protein [Phycisphaerales bacterium]
MSRIRRAASAAMVLGAFTLAAVPAQSQPEQKVTATDKLILRTGRIIDGKVLEETDTRVKFTVITAGISATQWFDKADILKVEKGDAPAPAEEPAPGATVAKPEAAKAEPAPADAKKVYVVNLKGQFGEDITQTPIRQAVADAKSRGANVLVFVLDNDWSMNQGGMKDELPNDEARFDELFRAEQITPIFMNEISREWENPPKVVFWVKQAMGGAAFLPFVSQNIYMSSDSRWGGIGNLSTLFGGTGDEVVRQKQYSLRMGHAEGWALTGGYDYRIVRAMAKVEYVLSYKMVGGQPQLLERMPEAGDEFLLTDDGKDDREDTIQALARGQGNDVLTLNADLARKLFISKGTVDSLDDLIYDLGLSRSSVRVDDKSDKIMEGWTRNLTSAKAELRELMQDYQQINVTGDYSERSRSRGAQIAKLTQMIQIIRRYKEALGPRWFRDNGYPAADADDVISELERIIERTRQQQMMDKK